MPNPTQKTEANQRNAARSTDCILQSATAEFAEYGLGGARVDRIAQRAGLNKRLIYYYFGDKEQLFQSVLENAYSNIRQQEQRLNLTQLAPREALTKLVEFTWDYYQKHPEFLTLLNSANLHKGRHLTQAKRMQLVNSPVIETLKTVLTQGELSGEFRESIDPLQLYISIAGLAYFYLSNSFTLSAAFGVQLLTPARKNARRAHMVEMVLAFVLR